MFSLRERNIFVIYRNISLRFSILISACPKERFDHKIIFSRKVIFSINILHWAEKMIFGQKISVVLSKVHSSCPAEGFERSLSLFQKFLILHHFRVLAESFRTFVEIISAALSILRFTSPAENFELRTLLKFKFFYPFPISAKKFVEIVTTAFNGSRIKT